MTSLGTAVRNVGGDWATTSAQVEKFIELQGRAYGFGEGPLVSSMSKLVTAGMSVAQAEATIGVAEDAARAKHVELTQVVDMLVQAEAGRAVGLIKLDPHLKNLIHDHADLSDIIRQLAHDMSGQAAAAADTYAGSADRLHVAWDTFARNIATVAMPALTNLINTFIGAGPVIADFFGGIERGIVGAAQAADNAITQLRNRNIAANTYHDTSGMTLSVSGQMAGIAPAEGGPTRTSPMATQPHQTLADIAHKQENDALWEAQHQAQRLQDELLANLGKMGRVGFVPKGSQSSGYTPPDPSTGPLPGGLGGGGGTEGGKDAAVAMLDDYKVKEELLKQAVDNATDSTTKQAATMALLQAKVADARAELVGLSAISQIDANSSAAQAARVGEYATQLRAAKNAQTTYNESLRGQKDLSETNKEAQRAIAAEVRTLTEQWNAASKALHDLGVATSENDALIARTVGNISAATGALGAAIAAPTLAWDKFTTDTDRNMKEQAATAGLSTTQIAAYYNDLLTKLGTITEANIALAQHYTTERNKALGDTTNLEDKLTNFFTLSDQKMREDLATAQMTDAQRLDFYTRMLGQMSTATAAQEQQSEQIYGKYVAAVEANDNAIAAAHKKWMDAAKAETESFISDVIVKHESLKDILAGIYDQILKNFVNMTAQMITQSPWMKNILEGASGMPILGGGAPPGTTPGGGLSSLVSGFGGGSTTHNGSSPGNALFVQLADAEGNYLSKVTGNVSGVSSSSLMSAWNSTTTTGLAQQAAAASSSAGSNQGLNAAESQFVYGYGPSGGAAITGKQMTSADIAGAISGAAIGPAISNIIDPNQNPTGASVGGAVGGGLATAFTTAAVAAGTINPLVGGAIDIGGMILGSLLGGLFGKQGPPATPNPLTTNASQQQWVANYQGIPFYASSDPGSPTFAPGNQYYTANNGQSMANSVQQQMQAAAANITNLTQAQKDQLLIMQGLGGASGSGLNITGTSRSGSTQMFTLQSGQTVTAAQLQQDVQNFMQVFGSTSTSPLFSLARTYPNFNASSLIAAGSLTTPAGTPMATAGGVTVLIQNPTIVGVTGLNTVAVAIGQAIKQASQGMIPGSPSTYRGIGPAVGNPNAGVA